MQINTRKKAFFKRSNKPLALILMLMLTAVLIAQVSVINAQTQTWPTGNTYAYVVATPSPIGVGQRVIVTMFLTQIPPLAKWPGEAGSVWPGFTLAITAPNGTTTTMGPYTSYEDGTAFATFTPDTAGTYTFQMSFAGFNLTTAHAQELGVAAYYAPSTSPLSNITVQQEPIADWTQNPSPNPNEYWQRPIYGQNQDWARIGGNWLLMDYDDSGNRGLGAYNPYSIAPTTAHIVWTNPIFIGGVVGQSSDSRAYSTTYPYSTTFFTGQNYQSQYVSPIVMAGKLYFTAPLNYNTASYGTYCIDLRTGKQVWFANGTFVNAGQLFAYNSPNQEGVIPYLWYISGTTWKMYDPLTGAWLATLNNAVAPQYYCIGPQGEILAYNYATVGNTTWLSCWNSTQIPAFYGGGAGYEQYYFRPNGKTADWRTGIMWNITEPYTPAFSQPGTNPYRILGATAGKIIVASYITTVVPPIVTDTAYDAKTGEFVWSANRTNHWDGADMLGSFPGGLFAQNGIYATYQKETLQWVGYSVEDGHQLWITPPTNETYDVFTRGQVLAYNMLFVGSYSGYLYAYNMTTGELAWKYYNGDSGLLGYGTGGFPYDYGADAAGGLVFFTVGYHSPQSPLNEGARLFAINATTGKQVWNITGWFGDQGGPSMGPIADGQFTILDSYDGLLKSFGKGRTATTVTTDAVVNNPSQVLIKGTVTDQSPGQTCLGIPAAGTPAISDQWMTPWMEYLYDQQPMPTDATGVKVTLMDVDPNGNTYTIGETTSDINGQYSYTFTPDIAGTYKIIAIFEGSGSYYGSSAQTIMTFDQPAATAAPTAASTSALETYFVPTIAILIIVMLVGFALLAFLMIRKRP
jgi:hypothetical protein